MKVQLLTDQGKEYQWLGLTQWQAPRALISFSISYFWDGWAAAWTCWEQTASSIEYKRNVGFGFGLHLKEGMWDIYVYTQIHLTTEIPLSLLGHQSFSPSFTTKLLLNSTKFMPQKSCRVPSYSLGWTVRFQVSLQFHCINSIYRKQVLRKKNSQETDKKWECNSFPDWFSWT